MSGGYVRSTLELNVTQLVDNNQFNVSCTASNSLLVRVNQTSETMMKEDERTVLLHIVRADDNDEEIQVTSPLPPEATGYCARYTGQICKGFLSGGHVWFNISSSGQIDDSEQEQQDQPASGGWLNEQLVTRLYQDVIRTLQQPCQSAAHVI